MRSEEQLEAQPGEKLEEKQPFPFVQSLTFGAGTFLTAGVVDLLAHLGPTGLVVGGIAAYVAAKHGPEIVEQVKELLPASSGDDAPDGPLPDSQQQRRSQRSLLDRALGRFPSTQETGWEEEPT